ncbi:MAG: hypothetical protein HQL17_07005 [Candidatus Omnitrophica bacterium]|nr:hypothetical protein [Candidatus Omnitrophota bacterium]
MSESESYQNWLSSKEHDKESLCLNCGACCGVFEDPCEHLMMTPEGKSHCRVYATRFGPHRSVSGESLYCVPIRQKIGHSWPGDERCGYKKFKLG